MMASLLQMLIRSMDISLHTWLTKMCQIMTQTVGPMSFQGKASIIYNQESLSSVQNLTTINLCVNSSPTFKFVLVRSYSRHLSSNARTFAVSLQTVSLRMRS